MKPAVWSSKLGKLLARINPSDVSDLQLRVRNNTVEIDGEVDSEIKRAAIAAQINNFNWAD